MRPNYTNRLRHIKLKKENLLTEIPMQGLVTTPLYNIGEHVYNLSDKYKETHSEIQWAMLAGVRHRPVHGYDGTNWNIIVNVVFNFSSCLIESDADRIRQKFLGS